MHFLQLHHKLPHTILKFDHSCGILYSIDTAYAVSALPIGGVCVIKRIFAALLCAMAAACLSGCAEQTPPPEEHTGTRIALSMSSRDQFLVTVETSVLEHAAKNQVDCTVWDAGNDYVVQMQHVKDAREQGYEVDYRSVEKEQGKGSEWKKNGKDGMVFQRCHHEIYLSDPRRTAPERLRTVIRQPVRLR